MLVKFRYISRLRCNIMEGILDMKGNSYELIHTDYWFVNRGIYYWMLLSKACLMYHTWGSRSINRILLISGKSCINKADNKSVKKTKK